VRIFRSGGLGGDITPSHTSGDLGAGPGGPAGTGRWLSPTRFIVAATIVVAVVLWLIPTLLRARQPSYELQCMAKLKQVGQAMTMYASDNQDYPPISNWHWAVRSYVSGEAEAFEDVTPGSRRDPLKCPLDPTGAPCSYLFLDRRELDYTMSRLSEAIIPLAVDEYFHEHATMVFYDGHADKMPKQSWVYDRLRRWKVRRDLDDPDSFSYELIPGTQKQPDFAPPQLEQTEKYIWPIF